MCTIPITIGAVIILYGIILLNKYGSVKNWTRTQAKITSIILEERIEPAEYGKIDYIVPNLKYSFINEGEEYEGNRLSVEVRNIIDPYVAVNPFKPNNDLPWSKWKAGDNIDIYFNPENPKENLIFPVLSKRRRSHCYAVTISGIIVLGIGILLCV